jgi:hypothetical protein
MKAQETGHCLLNAKSSAFLDLHRSGAGDPRIPPEVEAMSAQAPLTPARRRRHRDLLAVNLHKVAGYGGGDARLLSLFVG